MTAGKTSELVVLDAKTGKIRSRIELPADDMPPTTSRPDDETSEPASSQADKEGQLSYTGLVFAPNGDRIYMSNVRGSIKVFNVSKTHDVTPSGSWQLPPANAPRRTAEIPAGLAVSTDGSLLFVCGNLSNQLLQLDTRDGQVVKTNSVGVAPFDVVLANGKAYVSNWGGRRPAENDLVGPAGRGTTVRVDPVRHIASEGSVTVIDLSNDSLNTEIVTGLHASGLAVTSDERWLVCCNANSDTISLIDTHSDQVVGKLWSKPNAADPIGAAPNATVFVSQDHRLYVANGAQNAIAVFDFDVNDPKESRLLGMFPVGWYPGALVMDEPRNQLIVANIKGLPRKEESYAGNPQAVDAQGFNSHHYSGSLSIVPVPTQDQLPALSERVARNYRAPRIANSRLPARANQPPRAIPQRIGEPSLIKHVVYVIKENRTFDQVFGACGRGNGDPSLCIFGQQITPNHHKLAEQFSLLDNAYCCGILSADGHQWSTTAYSTDYMEKSFAGFPRSYPDGMGIDESDALAYSPTGFLWDHATGHGKTVRNYGEFMGPTVHWQDNKRPGKPDFMACYTAWKNQSEDVVFKSRPSIESIREYSPTGYVGWNMSVPDQFRADFVVRELAEYERKGDLPQLIFICLPQDHTSGTNPGCPTPAACMADNDLALGRIVEAFSHSRFWPQLAIFVIEDDPQNGWDHVSGYRTIAFCVSPYAKRKSIISTRYNTTCVLRTMEQILGLPPMNQFDASAAPMFDCFVDQPDLTPYTAVANNIPLDKLNPPAQAINDPQLQQDALVSAEINLREVDRAPEDTLNQILWRAMRGVKDPYPHWAIEQPAEDDDD